MIGPAISLFHDVVTGGSAAVSIYKFVSGIVRGNKIEQYLEEMAKNTAQLSDIRMDLKRLSDDILYAADRQAVWDITRSRQREVDDLRKIRESLEPLSRATGQKILSSAMIQTPDEMQKSMKNPWATLQYARPLKYADSISHPDMVPVLFQDPDSGLQCVGWVMPGMLRPGFNCEYENLWVPRQSEGITSPIVPEVQPAPPDEKVSTPKNSPSQVSIREAIDKLTVSESDISQSKTAGPTDPEGQYMMGMRCAHQMNIHEAMKWYRKAAEQNYTKAQVALGDIYRSRREDGTMMTSSREVVSTTSDGISRGLFHKKPRNIIATSVGIHERAFEIAVAQAIIRDDTKAVGWYRKAAEQGDMHAQYKLGSMYQIGPFEGKGVPQDFIESVKWYRKAAEQNYIEAQVALAIIYATGQSGVPQNYVEGMKWYRKATEQDVHGEFRFKLADVKTKLGKLKTSDSFGSSLFGDFGDDDWV